VSQVDGQIQIALKFQFDSLWQFQTPIVTGFEIAPFEVFAE
jgi:hypothetical protein